MNTQLSSIMIIFFISFITLSLGASYSFNFDYNATLKDWNLVQVAYCTDTFIENWNCGQACSSNPNIQDPTVIFEPKWDVRGLVGYDVVENIFYITFRGTVGSIPGKPQNDLLDAEFSKISYPYCDSCEVHKGFYDAFKDIQDQVEHNIQVLQAKYPQSKGIKVLGWSLGAAIAAHCAVFLETSNLINVVGYTTFGQPRVGNQEFALFFNSLDIPNAVRVTHNHDPVPRLPFIWMGFYHPNTEVWLTSDTENTYKICDPVGEDENCIDSVSIWNWNGDDHHEYMNVNSTSLVSCKKQTVILVDHDQIDS